jgi:hypothetical protein
VCGVGESTIRCRAATEVKERVAGIGGRKHRRQLLFPRTVVEYAVHLSSSSFFLASSLPTKAPPKFISSPRSKLTGLTAVS